MKRVLCLARLMVVIIQTGFGVCGATVFLEQREGQSVLLSCAMEPGILPPFAFNLKRGWLSPGEVIYQYKQDKFYVKDSAYQDRISASGDPSAHSMNVTISQLRSTDTDRYFCEFMVQQVGLDKGIPGNTEFFLLVQADVAPVSDGLVDLVQTCSGGSAVLPCHSPNGEGLAVEGVSLKRQRDREAVEVVYDSKQQQQQQHHSGARFPAERVRLSSALGPSGIAYNVTLQQLQPEDSALYSCQLLLRGRPDSNTRLGRRAFFVSVQGDRCGCQSYDTLLYGLSGVVGLLLVVLVGFVVKLKVVARRGANPQPQPPIYEEMVGVQSPSQKLASLHFEEGEYKNHSGRKTAPENHYESPSGALFPRNEAQK